MLTANPEIVVADKKNKGLDDHSLQMRFLRERAPQGTDSEDWSGTGNYTGVVLLLFEVGTSVE